MARRSSIFEDVSKLPWPVGIVLAVLCYPAVIFLKSYFNSNQTLVGIGNAISIIWPILSLLFLLAALASFVSQRNQTSMFRSHRSIDKIRSLTWRQFEQFIGRYFRDQGYFVVETPAGPDGGVDLVLRKDREKTYVQCKHWKTYKVGVEKVRALLGSMVAGGAHHGVLVATGEFTSSARQFGKKHGLRLIDGNELEHLLRVTLGPGEIEITDIDTPPECPFCRSAMVKRTAKKGPNPGAQFWVYSKFPACRGTLNI